MTPFVEPTDFPGHRSVALDQGTVEHLLESEQDSCGSMAQRRTKGNITFTLMKSCIQSWSRSANHQSCGGEIGHFSKEKR